MGQCKIKILGIAPYEGMRAAMMNLAQSRDDIELDVFVGDMAQGVEIVRQTDLSNYDAIISRGGTAQAIQKVATVPVIEVPISVYDILRAIKLAEDTTQKYAVVGFPGIADNARILYDLLGYTIEICTIRDIEELEPVLMNLKQQGCYMIICDMISSTIASRQGINSILISSGDESIQSSLDQAVKISRNFISSKSEAQHYLRLLNAQTLKLMDYASDGRLCLSTLDENLQRSLQTVIDGMRRDSHRAEQIKIKKSGQKLYRITRKFLLQEDEPHEVFFIDTLPAPDFPDGFLLYQNAEEVCSQTYISCSGGSASASFQRNQLERYSLFNYPVLIIGEPGTRKEEAASSLYAGSPFTSWPLITIDCHCMTDKYLASLTQKEASPLYEANYTLLFKNIQALAFPQHHQLFELIEELAKSQAHRFIFSYTARDTKDISGAIYEFLTDRLNCLQLTLTPLRERKEDIPYLASLYINHLNLEVARQVAGFEPGAIQLLEDFPWSANLSQLYRVLRELVLISSSPYITTGDIKKLLEKEERFSPFTHGTRLDTSLPLAELNRQIALLVMEEENGNQSNTAKRLGISRSTLWRMLK